MSSGGFDLTLKQVRCNRAAEDSVALSRAFSVVRAPTNEVLQKIIS
jgi:hypothetical protein